AWRDEDTEGAVDQRQLRETRAIAIAQRSARDRLGASHFNAPTIDTCSRIDTDDDIWVEDLHQSLEIACTRGCQECGHHRLLASTITSGMRCCSADATPRTARDLPCRRHAATHNLGDLVEAKLEHVMEHKCDALDRGQRLEHHQEG